MGRRNDNLIPFEVELYQDVLISDKSESLAVDSKDNDHCEMDHVHFMQNLHIEKERVNNDPILETDVFQSSLASIAIDDLDTIFEIDLNEDSGTNSTNSPAVSGEVCHDKFLQTMSDVDTNAQKTKLTPSMSPNVEMNDQLGPSVESRRPAYRRRSSTGSTLSTYDLDSSQSGSSRSSSHSLYSKQSFTRMRSNSSGDLSKYNHTSKFSSSQRQTFGRRSSLPGLCTPNSTWDTSVAESSPMIEMLRKNSLKTRYADMESPMIKKIRKSSLKTKDAHAASLMIQEINEGEAMAAAIAQKKAQENHETNKEREAQKNKPQSQSKRIVRPFITMDEPDDDGDLSMGSDDLSVSLGRSMNLDYSQSSRSSFCK
jgi:hypothetical protein